MFHLQDILPEGKPTTVPGGGMPGGVCDTSGDAGALREPARPRHLGDLGGRQPLPTTVPPSATSRSPGGRSMGATWGQTSAERGRSGNFGDSRRRRGGQRRRGLSKPTGGG